MDDTITRAVGTAQEVPQLMIERIPLSRIIIGGYQRDVVPSRVSRIVAQYNPAKLGILIVNRRKNLDCAVIDGQNRLAAMRLLNARDVACGVLEGLSVKEEADYFRFQKDNTRPLTAYDMYNASIYAEDQHYLAIDYILRKYGYHVSKRSGPRGITAISALSKIAQTFGFPVLQQTVEWISRTWPDDSTIVRQETLAGLAELASRFGQRIPTDVFAGRMSAYQPGSMLYEYRSRTQNRVSSKNAFNPTMRFTMCGVFVEKFNKGLGGSSKYRLRLDWDMPRDMCAQEVNNDAV
ncbi:hypothetical protein AGMMS49992_11770 [Clostridia bacterium]|nr:hypothetical protein AGMMS49992_11770 [Clostridia bacterium]